MEYNVECSACPEYLVSGENLPLVKQLMAAHVKTHAKEEPDLHWLEILARMKLWTPVKLNFIAGADQVEEE